ncbi:MAG: YbdK family carboxylate-amine ligase [Rhodanobacter sp.]|nr:MAG: YbdK family carboxylate-amine ligase [Rhodanobacter sp.]
MITIGLEEEVQVVDASGQLVPHDFSDGGPPARDTGEGLLDKEIHRCAIELKTRICRSVGELQTALHALREQARLRTAAQGQQILVAGLHPTAMWQQQTRHEGVDYPHYTRLIDEYQDVARSAFSFGMHLHLGFTVEVPKMAIMNRLRHVLPEVLALSASSPYFEGCDTGLQTWRHSLLDRYPRMGVPDVWNSEGDYQAHLQRLRQLGCVAQDQGLWQDLRLHHRYGTLEVRIMDSHPDLHRIGLIATLLKWEAETLALELASGRQGTAWSRACIEENKWRARRHGLQAQWIEWDRDEACSSAEHFERWWSRIAFRAADSAERNRWERRLADALSEGSYADALRHRAQSDTDWRSTLQWMVAMSVDEPPALQSAGGWR